MKIAIITDQHFGVRQDKDAFLNKFEQFYQNVFFPKLEEYGVDVVLDLGDTFDRRKQVNHRTLDRAKKMYFDPLQKKGIQVYAITGNHSVYFKDTNKVNSLRTLLSGYSNVNIIDIMAQELQLGSLSILMVPWITKDNHDSVMEKIKTSRANYLMGHFDIKGFEMLKGVIADHGFDRKTFSRFDQVFSGHYHHPSSADNITYLGAPYEMVWSDMGGRRGFHILDTETRDLDFIPNPHISFNTIDYDDTELSAEDMEELSGVIVDSDLSDMYIKVIVKEKTNPYLYDIFCDKLLAANCADLKFQEPNTITSNVDIEDIDDLEDTMKIIDTFVSSITKTEDTQKTVSSYLKSLHDEALTLD